MNFCKSCRLRRPQRKVATLQEILMALGLVLFMHSVQAEGNLAITVTMQINAPAPLVWSKIRDFNALNTWHPAVANDEIMEGENNVVGAVRLLTLGDGGTIKEKLLAWDDAGMSLTYNILEGVLPVRNYVSTLKVESLPDKNCKVIWAGSFSAAPGTEDRKASGIISSFYDEGLVNLKKINTP
ncbi:MAG: SRPBCC family protein [Gammaproteobacteria bacterium]